MEAENKVLVTDLSELLHQLIESYHKMLGTINKINSIMNKTKLLSLNSSIEAARAGEAGKGFAVIASEIQKFSDQSKAANAESLGIIQDLNHRINQVIGVRTADVAFDLIDKIDRNLFERNCDVQAWATFDKIVDFATEPDDTKQVGVIELLYNLYNIYEVYYDIVMADKNGKVVATGVNKDIIGTDISGTDWFINASKTEGCSVSDMYFSSHYKDYTISYSCKILDKKGNFAGVLSTRFNWNFIYDILDKAKVGALGEVYVINNGGIVIASKDRSEVLNRDLRTSYPIIKKAISGDEYGYVIEQTGDKLVGILGYAHTKGYNAYPGKAWSVVVRETF